MDSENIKVLLLEDEAAHAEAIRRALKSSSTHYKVRVAGTLREYRESVAADPPDIALLDMVLPDGGALELLPSPPASSPFPLVVMTSYGDEQTAVAAMKAGALDYIVKSPETFADMPRIVSHAMEHWQLLQESRQAQQALKESEEKYRLIIENSRDIIYTQDIRGEILFASPSVKGVLGYDPAELVGRSFQSFIHPDDTAACEEAMRKVIELGEQTLGFEYRVKDRSGNWHWLASSAVRVLDADGSFLYFLGIIHDITVRKQAEQTLRESEEKYRSLVENINDVFYTLDNQGNITYVSPVVERLSKYKAGDLIGKPFTGLVYTDDLPGLLDSFNRLVAGQLEPWEFRIVDKDGSIIFVRTSSRPMYKEGEIVGFTALITDITGRKKAQDLQRISEERYRNVVENANEIIIVAQDGLVKFANRKMEEISGYSREELLSVAFIEFVHPDDRQFLVESEFRKLSGDKFVAAHPVRLIDKGGQVIWMEISAVVINWEGRPATLNFVSDITERRRSEAALRQSEERYRSLIVSALEAVIVIQDGLVRYANPRAFDIMGSPREQLEPRPFMDFIHPDDRDMVIDRHLRRLKGEELEAAYPIRLVDNRGNIKWVQISTAVISWQGRPATLTFMADISQNKRAERVVEIQRDLGIKLSMAEDLNQALQPCLAAAIEISGMDSGGIYLVDADTGDLRLVCNSGLSREFIDGASRFPESSANARLVMAGKPVYTQYQQLGASMSDVRKSEGLKAIALVPVSSRNRVIACLNIASHSEEDVPAGARNTLETIASQIGGAIESLQAKEALQQSEEKYRNLVELLHEGIWAIDEDARTTYVNTHMAEMLGYTVEEMQGKELFSFMDERGRELAAQNVERRREGISETHGFEFLRKDGTRLYASLSTTPITGKDGKYNGAIAGVQDITDSQRLAEERQRVEKLESIGVLAGGIAHDFNNILTAILGNISLARMEAAPGSDLQNSLEQAEKASLRAKDLTVQLLTFSRGGAPVTKLTSISALLKDTVSFALRGSNVKCRFSIPAGLWRAKIDEGQVSQVINNLVINAQQAMPGGGAIKLTAENLALSETQSLGRGLPLNSGDYVRISVTDHGSGIPAEHLEKIFDPFFTTKQKGSGLGLATSFSIARQHGGHLSVESEAGSGSTFYLYLPASTQKVTPKQDKRDKKEKIKPAGKARILVMDDEQGVREVAGRMLTHIGYQDVEFAADGAAAIKLYKAAMKSGNPFSVAILDLTIAGGMGGEETIKKLLKIDPAVKAIVSSGYVDDSVIANYRDYGFSGVVAKPYTLEQLRKALQDVIG
jgi:PAS domain S-box-containing protein